MLDPEGTPLPGGWGVVARPRRPARSTRLDDYRDARAAAEWQRETVTLGYHAETVEYHRTTPMPTLRTWLRDTRNG